MPEGTDSAESTHGNFLGLCTGHGSCHIAQIEKADFVDWCKTLAYGPPSTRPDQVAVTVRTLAKPENDGSDDTVRISKFKVAETFLGIIL